MENATGEGILVQQTNNVTIQSNAVTNNDQGIFFTNVTVPVFQQ